MRRAVCILAALHERRLESRLRTIMVWRSMNHVVSKLDWDARPCRRADDDGGRGPRARRGEIPQLERRMERHKPSARSQQPNHQIRSDQALRAGAASPVDA